MAPQKKRYVRESRGISRYSHTDEVSESIIFVHNAYTLAAEATSPIYSGLDSPAPGRRGFAAFPSSPSPPRRQRTPTSFPMVFLRPSISCYFIVSRLNSSLPPVAPVIRNALLILLPRARTYRNVWRRASCTYAGGSFQRGTAGEELRGRAARGCMQIHRVLSIKYSTQGDHVLSSAPCTPYDYLLPPGTYIAREKRKRLPSAI